MGGANAPSAAELGYVKGLTSAAQTQLDAKATNALDASLAAGEWSGVIRTLTASGTITAGTLVSPVLATSLKWAVADVSTDLPVVGIALETKTNAAMKVLLCGRYKFASTQSWTVGVELFRHATSDGLIQAGAPNTTTQKIQKIGWAEAADTIFFNPSSDVFTVT